MVIWGGSTISIPASIPGVIAVGAFDHAVFQQRSVFFPWEISSKGPGIPDSIVPKPDIIAPGVNIVSVNNGDGSPQLRSGTSMAVPHVSGGTALLRQAFPNATAQEIINAILASAEDLGYPVEVQGRGMVNFEVAYKLLNGTYELSGDYATTANPVAIHDGNEVVNNFYTRFDSNSYFVHRVSGTTRIFNVSLTAHIPVNVVPMVEMVSGNIEVTVPESLTIPIGTTLFPVTIEISSTQLEYNKAIIYFVNNATGQILDFSNITIFSQTQFSRGTVLFDLSKDFDTRSGYYWNDGPRGKFAELAKVLTNEGFYVIENRGKLTDDILADVNVLIISDPDLIYAESEKLAIRNFVDNNGGGLWIFGNGGDFSSEEDFYGTFQLLNLNSILGSLGSYPDTGIKFNDQNGGTLKYNLTNLGFNIRTSTEQDIVETNIPLEFFGIDLELDDNAEVLAYHRALPVAAATESGEGRIIVFGSSMPFDSRAMSEGRLYGYSTPEDVDLVAQTAISWLNSPKEISVAYEYEGVSYSRNRDLRVTINEAFQLIMNPPILPDGTEMQLTGSTIESYIVYEDNPSIMIPISFIARGDGSYAANIQLPFWGNYKLFTPFTQVNVGQTDGKLGIFVDLANYLVQDQLQSFGRFLFLFSVVSWLIWVRNEGGRKYRKELEKA